MHAAIEQGVSWFSYWDSHDVDRKFEFNPLEYSLGLLTNDGRVKEQGRVFQRLAEAYRGKPVVFPKGSPPAPAARPHRQGHLGVAAGLDGVEAEKHVAVVRHAHVNR